MLVYLKDKRGFTATLKTFQDKVEYKVSHTTMDYEEKRVEQTTPMTDHFVVLGWLLKGLLNEGFDIVDIIN
jgi:hypothetical protein